MPDPRLDPLRREFLAAGVSPREVRRLIAELEDHFQDLQEEARDAGLVASDATRDALARLGPSALLVKSAVELGLGDPLIEEVGPVRRTEHLRRWCLAICGSALFTGALLFMLHFAITH